jgi:hypothetical protein
VIEIFYQLTNKSHAKDSLAFQLAQYGIILQGAPFAAFCIGIVECTFE